MTQQIDVNGHHRPRVLVVDDAPVNRLVLSEALGEDYEVLLADDGPGAVRLAGGEARPDLILLDRNLPKKDGREVLAEIKDNPTLKRIPVVVLTTSKAEEDIYRSYDLGVNSFVSKPVNFSGMTAVMKALGTYWFEIVELPYEQESSDERASDPRPLDW